MIKNIPAPDFLINSNEKAIITKNENNISIQSKLEKNQHTYMSFYKWECDNQYQHLNFILYTNTKSISLVVFFINHKGERISSEILPSNQASTLEIPHETKYISFSIRIYEKDHQSRSIIYSLLFGEQESFSKKLVENHPFHINWKCYEKTTLIKTRENREPSTQKPFLILESIFCDYEENQFNLERYYKLFEGLFLTVISQSYDNFNWFIYISTDKSKYIKRIKEMVTHFDVSSFVYIIEYTHPSDGYENKTDPKIGRRMRPNLYIRKRADELLSKALAISKVNTLIPDLNIIRIGVDDDDFFTSHHFSNIVEKAQELQVFSTDNTESIICFKNIGCAYFNISGSIELELVEMNKIMYGSRVSCGKGFLPTNTVRISENSSLDSSSEQVKYHIITDNKVGFIYNRHGKTYSNQNKEVYYEKMLEKTKLTSSSNYIDYLTNK